MAEKIAKIRHIESVNICHQNRSQMVYQYILVPHKALMELMKNWKHWVVAVLVLCRVWNLPVHRLYCQHRLLVEACIITAREIGLILMT